MRICNAAVTAGLLPYPALVENLKRVIVLRSQGLALAPPRMATPLDTNGAVLLTMPAVGHGLAVVKVISVSPGNQALDLPLIRGEVLVLDAATGERLGVLDGPTVTARRTAAVSLVAASLLAQQPTGPLLIVGAGVQAMAHLEAFATGLGVRQAFICSRRRSSADRLAGHARNLGIEAAVVDTPGDAPPCPLVVTATTSAEPVLPNKAVPPNGFLAAIGNFSPRGTEVPASLVRRSRLYVDDLDGAMHEAGEYLLAGVDWTAVTPLEKALTNPAPAAADRPVVFKSVGCALWDLAAALTAFSAN